MMRYGLTEETINKINTVLASHPSIEKAVLFGSRAKGNFRPGSDIDLSLYGETISSKELGEISSELDDLLLPYSIDLTIFNDLDHAKLREHIERVGKIFYQRGSIVKGQGGAVKKRWQTKNLGDLCYVIGGGTPSKNKPEFYSGDIPWATVRDMRQEVITETECKITKEAVKCSSTNIIPGGNVVIATRVGLGKICILGQDTAINQDLRGIVPINPNVLSVQFLYWWLKKSADLIVAEGTGATVQGVKLPFVKSLQVPHIPLPEQQRIVGILDKAFDGITTAKANAEKNLQNSRAIFHSSLKAAITGELTSEWRSFHHELENASKHLKQALGKRCTKSKGAGKYVEPHPPVSNEQIKIPTSWILASPEQLSTNIIDCPHSTPKWTKSGVICLRTTNFKPGFLNLESVQFVSEETYTERIMRLEPKPGDVLYSREGGILGIACIFPDGLKACLGQRMMHFRLDSHIALPEYFTGVLNSPLILSEVKKLTGGAAAPHLNIRDIRTFPIPLPPIAEQHEIVNKIKTISSETHRLESIYQQKLAALDTLKKSLLDQAFTCQL